MKHASLTQAITSRISLRGPQLFIALIAAKIIFIGLAVMVVVSLVGCANAPSAPVRADLGYTHLGVYKLKIQQVDVQMAYRAPLTYPNIEHQMPVPPERAVRQWARDRLHVQGGAGAMQVIIEDASVVESVLETKKGLSGLFVKEAGERYDAHLRVRVENTLNFPSFTINASRYVLVSKDASLKDRETKWLEMVDALMVDFNLEMEASLRTYYGSVLLP